MNTLLLTLTLLTATPVEVETSSVEVREVRTSVIDNNCVVIDAEVIVHEDRSISVEIEDKKIEAYHTLFSPELVSNDPARTNQSFREGNGRFLSSEETRTTTYVQYKDWGHGYYRICDRFIVNWIGEPEPEEVEPDINTNESSGCSSVPSKSPSILIPLFLAALLFRRRR